MESEVRASIDVQQEVLRYAEVECYGEQRRLLRLGSCDFSFDAAKELSEGGNAEHLDTMAGALEDVFAGSSVRRFNLVLHPPACYSFFTPVPAGFSASERKQRLQEEASLLAQAHAGTTLRLTEDALYQETLEEEQVTWYHVLVVEEGLWKRLQHLLGNVPSLEHRTMLSMQGAAQAVTMLAQKGPPRERPRSPAEAPYTLALGWYPTHVEYTLCREGSWYFSHYTPSGSPTDCAYFAITLLNRLELMPQAVNQLYLYGNTVDVTQFDLLEQIFGIEPERLSALHLVDVNPERFSVRFSPEAYATCIGAAL